MPSHIKHAAGACLAAFLLVVPALRGAGAAEWHVSPSAADGGDGSEALPWDIETAFGHPAQVQPGDTIWIHGGTYVVEGGLMGVLIGTPEAPIIVRQYPGERATLDTGGSTDNRVFFEGAYTWYWGFEIMSSGSDRWADNGESADRGYGVDSGNNGESPGIKLINLVIHDAQGGIGFWRGATDGEIYGCLIYYVGYDYEDRGHGHAIYTQNETGTKRIVDNIMFGQYSHGIHAYGSAAAFLDNFHVEGNISFNNGTISTVTGFTRNILVGGETVARSPRLIANCAYFTPSEGSGTSCNLGYGEGVTGAEARDNTCVSGGTAFIIDDPAGPVISGNEFYGNVEGFAQADFPDNIYHDLVRPTGAKVIVRPNLYEEGRAHICVFNWDNLEAVEADVSGVLRDGEDYAVLDAQNYFGPPVAGGTYDGGTISLPMNLTEVAQPYGTPVGPVTHTLPEFGAFVLVRSSEAPIPSEPVEAVEADAGPERQDASSDAGEDGPAAGAGEGCGSCSAAGGETGPAWMLALMLMLTLTTRRRDDVV